MKLVPNSVSRSIAMKVLTAKKNSPHIFFAVGVVGVVGSAILACKSTLKLEETLDGIKDELKHIKDRKEEADRSELPVVYTDDDYRRDLSYLYGRSSVKLVRLYGPSIVIGTASIAALAGSHVQLTRRNAALTATVTALGTAFEEYRQRVREELGDDKEREIYHNIKPDELSDSKEVVKFKAETGMSPYAKLFSEHTTSLWQPNAENNRIVIMCQQQYFNNRLHAQGHVFLNEVYDALGFDHTPAGAVVGWVRHGDGDGYIDFGLFELAVNNREPSVWLDFNVDGVIYDKI